MEPTDSAGLDWEAIFEEYMDEYLNMDWMIRFAAEFYCIPPCEEDGEKSINPHHVPRSPQRINGPSLEAIH